MCFKINAVITETEINTILNKSLFLSTLHIYRSVYRASQIKVTTVYFRSKVTLVVLDFPRVCYFVLTAESLTTNID